MSSSVKRRFLRFIQFSVDLRFGITYKGFWEFDLFVTNDLIEKKDDTEPLRAVGFHLNTVSDDKQPTEPENPHFSIKSTK